MSVAWDVSTAYVTVPLAAHTEAIQWFWGQPDLPPTFVRRKTPASPVNTFTLATLNPNAVLFHRNKDGTLIELLKRQMWEKTTSIPSLSVVMPFCSKDMHLALKALSWMAELSEPLPRTIVLHYDNSVLEPHLGQIKKAASRAFKDVVLSRYPAPRRPHIGWPAACNYAFRTAASFMEQRLKTSWFWCEADSAVLTSGWLQQIESEYAYGQKPFMGTIIGDFDGLRMGHINGTAVYPWNATSYFPKAVSVIGYPWDAGMRDEMIHLAHRANHLMQHCGAVINGCCKPANGPQAIFRNQKDVDQLIQPGAVFFHPDKTGTLIDRLRERKLSKQAF
jgi:hypothetical protein